MSPVFTDEQLEKVAGRARPLRDRLHGPAGTPSGDPPIESHELLEKWRDRYPSEPAFEARLAKAGITEDDALNAVRADGWPAGEPLPDWVATLEELAAHAKSADLDECSVPGSREDVPFADLAATLVDYSVERLTLSAVDRVATENLQRTLLDRISSVSVRVLYVEFKSFVEYHDPDLAVKSPDAVADPPTRLYERFIESLHGAGFRNLCIEYPVLARQLVRLVTQWVEAVEEVDKRIGADRDELHATFDVAGPVRSLDALAEDTHQGGRVPLRVSFRDGSVIYKPRSVTPGQFFYDTVERLAEVVPSLPAACPQYLSREEYGWMEPVPDYDAETAADVDSYYERAGSLLCLAYAINFNDIQFENLIASGADPVVVDCETVFHPDFDPESLPHPVSPAIMSMVNDSVLVTELLPWFLSDPRDLTETDSRETVAALGSDGDVIEMTTVHRPTIEAANTDLMSVDLEHPVVDPSSSLPSVDDETVPAGGFVDELCRGFETTYRTISPLRDRGEWFGSIVDRDRLEGVRTRALFRASARYAEVLQSARSRDCLRDGVRFSIELEDLAVPFFSDDVTDQETWPLFASERDALYRLDVPRFETGPNDSRLYYDGSPEPVLAVDSGYSVCRERVEAMDESDRRQQTWLIRQCFEAEKPPASAGDSVAADDDRIRDLSADLFDDVIESALPTDTGRQWWSIVGAGSRLTFVPAELSVYNGRSGIAVTAAGLYQTVSRERYRRVAVEILDQVVDKHVNREDPTPELLRHGGTMGIGSILYALTVVGDLCDEDRYHRRAVDVVEMTSEEFVTRDETYDVTKGTAGTLLGLLASYDRHGESVVLDRAVRCGEHLLEHRTSLDGVKVWPTLSQNTTANGFAHGNDGIGYALARLYEATGERRFAEAARGAIAFDASGSRLQRDRTHEVGQREWCWGPAGMLLARVGAGRAMDDPALVRDTDSIVKTLATSEQSLFDNVCCGNFGRIESLLFASRTNDAAAGHAHDLATRCIARRERDGTFSLPGHSESVVNPTFFNGVSGVAYTLLRLIRPEALPSVALLE